jgi:hypothetical protein
VVDVLRIVERSATAVRAGIIGRLTLYDDLEARVSIVPVITSPDSLGLSGADFAQLGIRWRWATAP